MAESVAVIIPVFGDLAYWMPLVKRAEASVMRQAVPTIAITVPSYGLSEARNNGVASAPKTDWLIFCDADDELDLYYVEHMLQGTGDIRQPSTIGVVDDKLVGEPNLIPPYSEGLLAGNHLIIGSMVRRELFLGVGGFRDLPVLEDWDLWIRLALVGAEITQCPEAIYRIHVNPGSRNMNEDLKRKTATEIRDRYRDEWIRKFGQ